MIISMVSIVVSIFVVAQLVTVINCSSSVIRGTGTEVTRPTISEGSSSGSEKSDKRSTQLNVETKKIENDQHSSETHNRPQFQSLDLHARNLPQDRSTSRDQYLQQTKQNGLAQFSALIPPSQNGAVSDLSYSQQLKNDASRTLENQQLRGSNGQTINQRQIYNRNQQTPEGHHLLNSRQQAPIQVQHYNDRQNTQPQQFYNVRPNVPSQQQTYNVREQSHEQQKQILDARNPQLDNGNLYNTRHQSNEQQKQQIYNSRQQSPDQKILNFNARQQFSEPQHQLYNVNQQSNEQQEQLYTSRQQLEGQQKHIYNTRKQFNEPEKYYNSRQQPHGSQKQPLNTLQQTHDAKQQTYYAGQQFLGQQNNLYNNRQPREEDKQFYNSMQQSQDKQQFSNAMQQSQNQESHNARQLPHEQLKMYNMEAINNQDIHLNKGTSLNLSQARSESPVVLSQGELLQVRSKDLQNTRKDIHVSAIENGELSLPRSSSDNSGSVEVSDLTNLQSDMVKNGGYIPSTYATDNGQDTPYKRSASLSQHVKTPYARYEYSHTL